MRKKKSVSNMFLTIVSIIAIITNIYFIYNIVLLGPIEPVIRTILCLFLLIIDILLIYKTFIITKTNYKKPVTMLTIGLILFSISNILLGYTINYFYQKLESVNKEYIIYSSSLIVLKNSSVSTIDEVNNLTIGIINDTTSTEGYKIPKAVISDKNLDDKNVIKEYNDFAHMLTDFYKGEIDAVFLSKNYAVMFSSVPGFEAIGDETKIVFTKEQELVNEDKTENNTPGASVTKPFTVLLMGVDSEINGMNKNAAFNGDSLILATFNPKTLNVTLTSIPRDSYVPIACFAGKKENKITHAAWYGASCMMKTIESFTGIKIDYYAKVNFKAVVSLVEALGGVDVDVEYSMCEQNSDRKFGNKTVYIKKGFQTLNGEQALAYSRNRHAWPAYCSSEWNQGARSDIVRGEHQQKVIESISKKLKDIRSVDKVLELINLISSNIDTNMSTNEILSFYNIGKDIISKGFSTNGNIVSINKLNIKTSSQMIYDEGTKLVLSNQIINKWSLDETVDAMKYNLEIKKPELIKEFDFSINETYVKNIVGNGKYPATTLYKLLPNFIGQSKSSVLKWADENNFQIKFADNGTGTVIKQSHPAKKRLDLISNREITITLSNSKPVETPKIDCSTDKDNELCKMPNFVGKNKTTVTAWLNKLLGVKAEYKEVDISLAPGYKEGTIIKQSIAENTLINNTKTIIFSIVTKQNETPSPTPEN